MIALLALAYAAPSTPLSDAEARAAAHPADADALADLALQLSWTPGHLPEAIDTWRRALALRPNDPRLRLGLARTLAWAGVNAESARLYDALLAEQPANPEVLLGRSQLARWTGDRATARALLERAEAAAPTDPRVRAERSRLELDSDRVGVARRAANEALTLAPNLYEAAEAKRAVHAAVAPRTALQVTATTETTDVTRIDVAVPVGLHLLPDTTLTLTPGYSLVNAYNRVSIDVAVHQTGLPQGLYLRGAYGFHQLLDVGATHAFALEVGASHPLDAPLQVHLGARKRALIDLPAGDDPIAALNVVGSGGAIEAGVTDRLEVSEAYAGLSLAPWSGMYVYGDGVVGAVGDGDARRTVAAGLGQDFLRLLAKPSPFGLTLKYDLYFLSVAEPDTRFFSPAAFTVHTPGVEARWSPGPATIGVEGGLPFRVDAPAGWLVGAYAGARLGEHLRVGARFRVMDDTAWRATGGTVLFDGRW